MTLEQRLAILTAACVRANIRAIAMQAENVNRVYRGEQLAYDAQAFLTLIDEEGLGYNDVITQVAQ